jgi:hypothetical protein
VVENLQQCFRHSNVNAKRVAVGCSDWLGVWCGVITLFLFCLAPPITNINSPKEHAHQNERDNENSPRDRRRVEIRVAHWTSRVEKEGGCDEPHRDTDQDPRIYSLALRAWHRPNENKVTDRCRERARIALNVFEPEKT